MTTPTKEEVLTMADRLAAPAYWFTAGFDNRSGHWFSGSQHGHEGENDAPFEAAKMLRAYAAMLEPVSAEEARKAMGIYLDGQICQPPEDCMHSALQLFLAGRAK